MATLERWSADELAAFHTYVDIVDDTRDARRVNDHNAYFSPKSRPITIALPEDLLVALHELAAGEGSARGWGHRTTYADIIRREMKAYVARVREASASTSAAARAGAKAARDIVKATAPKKASKGKATKTAARRRRG